MQSPHSNDGAKPLLSFERPLAIVGGGDLEPAFLQELASRGVALVAADGGAHAVAAAGLLPAAIIGDLDSLTNRDEWEARTRVIHIPEQITTDFQKALYSTSAPVTLALGMTGKRLDHTLVAFSTLHEVAHARHVILVDEVDIAISLSGPFAFAAQAGERIAVHPLVPVSFQYSRGLLYPLDGLTLDPVGRLGMSNAGTGGRVEIVPRDDTPWLLILGRERLWDLVAAYM